MREGCELSHRSQDFRAVFLRLESSAPPGCQITVDLNGESSILRPGCARHHGMMVEERRFAIAPLGTGGIGRTGSAAAEFPHMTGICGEGIHGSAGAASSSRAANWAQDVVAGRACGDADSPDGLHLGADSPRAQTSAGDVVKAAIEASIAEEPACEQAGCASFSATVMLDTCEVQAKTTQELQEPEIEVVEVFDTSVVVRMGGLTGDRFELTVYASGAVESLGAAATLVQRGPVRTAESVHRIGQLESSQVYVAWVRVFCESHVMESKQKGFKTLPARVKTIWDEADHVILGVSHMATSKEITKAWRHKSLQFHPDKETDPDKKDAAEEMMKRLNLAKQNMLRSAPLDDGPSSPSAAPPGAPDIVPRREPDTSGQGSRHRDPSSNSSSSSDEDWSSQDGKACQQATPKSPKFEAARLGSGSSEDEVSTSEDSLRCSLRVEAPKSPKLKVVTRGLTSLDLEASGLPSGNMVEVQCYVDGIWKAVTGLSTVTSPCMRFTIKDLEENSSYRFRLRTIVELEPLRLLFAEFAENTPCSQEDPAPPPHW